jgi:hypothetical protein
VPDPELIPVRIGGFIASYRVADSKSAKKTTAKKAAKKTAAKPASTAEEATE